MSLHNVLRLPPSASLPIRLTTFWTARAKRENIADVPTKETCRQIHPGSRNPQERGYRSQRKVKIGETQWQKRSHREDSDPNRWLARTRVAPTLFVI
ncbi:unnamed protein product [Ixodes hexagonus]